MLPALGANLELRNGAPGANGGARANGKVSKVDGYERHVCTTPLKTKVKGKPKHSFACLIPRSHPPPAVYATPGPLVTAGPDWQPTARGPHPVWFRSHGVPVGRCIDRSLCWAPKRPKAMHNTTRGHERPATDWGTHSVFLGNGRAQATGGTSMHTRTASHRSQHHCTCGQSSRGVLYAGTALRFTRRVFLPSALSPCLSPCLSLRLSPCRPQATHMRIGPPLRCGPAHHHAPVPGPRASHCRHPTARP